MSDGAVSVQCHESNKYRQGLSNEPIRPQSKYMKPKRGKFKRTNTVKILVDRESRRSFDNFSANHDPKQGRTIITLEHFI